MTNRLDELRKLAEEAESGLDEAMIDLQFEGDTIIELLYVVEKMRDVLESIARREEYPIAKAAYSLAALEKWNASDS